MTALLSCDSCRFGADNGALLDKHALSAHQRPASRVERTPRPTERAPLARAASLLDCMAALGAPVAGEVWLHELGWVWRCGCGAGDGAGSELAAVQALIRHHRKDAA